MFVSQYEEVQDDLTCWIVTKLFNCCSFLHRLDLQETATSSPNRRPVSQHRANVSGHFIVLMTLNCFIIHPQMFVSVIRPVMNQQQRKKTDPVAKWVQIRSTKHTNFCLPSFTVSLTVDMFGFLVSAGISSISSSGTCLNFLESRTGELSAWR